MKIYIITEGEYSEYKIKKVFIDKIKAEKYVKFNQEAYIEIWDTEEKKFEEINYIKARIDKDRIQEYTFDYLSTNTLDIKEDDLKIENEAYFFYRGYNIADFDFFSLEICQILPKNNYSEKEQEELELKYKKILQDKLAEIKSLILIEGWSEPMINDWLDKDNKKGGANGKNC